MKSNNNFKFGRKLINFNVVVEYDGKNNNKFMWKIKGLKDKEITTLDNLLDSEKIIVNKFTELLTLKMKDAEKNGENLIFIMPPTKPNNDNQVKKLLDILLDEYNYIEIHSEIEFELKNMNHEERRSFLSKNYKNWSFTTNFDNKIIETNKYVFVDDMTIKGLFMKYCLVFVEEKVMPDAFQEKNTSGIFLSKQYQGEGDGPNKIFYELPDLKI